MKEKEDRIVELAGQVASLQEREEWLEGKVLHRDVIITNMREQLDDAEGRAGLLEDLQDDITDKDRIIAALREDAGAAEKELEVLRAGDAADAAAKEDQIRLLQREVQAVTARSVEKAAHIEDVEREIRGVVAGVEEKNAQVAELEAGLEALQAAAEIAAEKEEVIAGLEEEVEELRIAAEEHARRAAQAEGDLERQMAKAREAVVALEGRLADAEGMAAELPAIREELEGERRRAADSERAHEALRDELEAVKGQLSAREEALGDAKRAVEVLEERAEGFAADVRRAVDTAVTEAAEEAERRVESARGEAVTEGMAAVAQARADAAAAAHAAAVEREAAEGELRGSLAQAQAAVGVAEEAQATQAERVRVLEKELEAAAMEAARQEELVGSLREAVAAAAAAKGKQEVRAADLQVRPTFMICRQRFSPRLVVTARERFAAVCCRTVEVVSCVIDRAVLLSAARLPRLCSTYTHTWLFRYTWWFRFSDDSSRVGAAAGGLSFFPAAKCGEPSPVPT